MKSNLPRKLFLIVNNAYLFLTGALCLLPILHILAVSLSGANPADAGKVMLWPLEFTPKAYRFIMEKPEFTRSFLISLERVGIGVPVCMLLTVLVAFPLSRKDRDFPGKNRYAWFFIFTMLFGGGLIPQYLTVMYTGLMNSIWALIIPGAVPVGNVIILLNFFKTLPDEIAESAYIDGAGHWTTLFKIYLPLSLPALATLTLFCTVAHWNSWLDGIIYMDKPINYPLQSYLRGIIVGMEAMKFMSPSQILLYANVSAKTTKAAQIFIATVPILAVYPFLQKYFMTGIVLGSVKG